MKLAAQARAASVIFRAELGDVLRHPLPIFARCLTMPIYVVALSAIWSGIAGERFAASGVAPIAYFVLTQTILDSWLSRFSLNGLFLGFEAALVRPLSWNLQAGAHAAARSCGQILFVGAAGQLVLLGAGLVQDLLPLFRLALIAPFLACVDALLIQLLTCVFLRLGRSDGLRFILSKAMLTLGGGLYPLLGEEAWTRVLRALPFSDFVFQPAYFCLTGHASGMPTWIWLLRVVLWIGALSLCAQLVFRSSLRRMQNFGA